MAAELKKFRCTPETVQETEWRADGAVWTRDYIDGEPQEWRRVFWPRPQIDAPVH